MSNTSLAPSKSELTKHFPKGNEGKLYLVTSRGSWILKRCDGFVPGSMACLICERNFDTDDEYFGHNREHRQGNRNIKSAERCNDHILDLQYKKHLAGTKLGFMIRSKTDDIIIENIMLWAPKRPIYFRKDQVPFALNDYTDFLVTLKYEQLKFHQKIFIAMYHKGKKEIRRVECFEFKVFFEGTMENVQLAYDVDLEFYAVPEEEDMELNNKYLKTTRLEEGNAEKVFKKLVQLEDYALVAPYRDLFLKDIALIYEAYMEEERICIYWIDMPDNEIFEIIKANDEALVSIESDPDFEYVGIVDSVSQNGIYIELYGDFTKETVGLVNIRFYPCRLILRYQYRALDMLGNDAGMRKYLFPSYETKTGQDALLEPSLNLINTSIGNNPEQLQAVKSIIMGSNSRAPYIIFGPPGTGKTTTVVEAILQLRLRNPECRVLVTAGSNSACNTIALRLIEHFNKTPHATKCYELLRICSKSAVKDVSRIDVALLDYSNCCLKILKKRSRRHNYPILEEIMKYGIVIATLATVGKLVSGACGPFNYIFVDEAGASTEPETLIAIMGIKTNPDCQVILSGDHKQLGPVIMSTKAAALGLAKSLMMRLMELETYQVQKDGSYDCSIQTRLRRNYRSHPEIVRLYNVLFYNSELLAEAKLDDVGKYSTLDLVPNAEFPIIFKPVYGTVSKEAPSTSSYNQREIDEVLKYLKRLLNVKVSGEPITEKDIGVITPYKLQSQLITRILKQRDWNDIEVGSVEKFQGQEKPIIIATFVRSFCGISFVSEPRRLNVLMSRAKSLLILIGNPKTLSQSYDFRFIIHEIQLRSGNVTSKKNIENLVTHQDTSEHEKSNSQSEAESEKNKRTARRLLQRMRYKENRRANKEKCESEEIDTKKMNGENEYAPMELPLMEVNDKTDTGVSEKDMSEHGEGKTNPKIEVNGENKSADAHNQKERNKDVQDGMELAKYEHKKDCEIQLDGKENMSIKEQIGALGSNNMKEEVKNERKEANPKLNEETELKEDVIIGNICEKTVSDGDNKGNEIEMGMFITQENREISDQAVSKTSIEDDETEICEEIVFEMICKIEKTASPRPEVSPTPHKETEADKITENRRFYKIIESNCEDQLGHPGLEDLDSCSGTQLVKDDPDPETKISNEVQSKLVCIKEVDDSVKLEPSTLPNNETQADEKPKNGIYQLKVPNDDTQFLKEHCPGLEVKDSPRLEVAKKPHNETQDYDMIEDGQIFNIEESIDKIQLTKDDYPAAENHKILHDGTKIYNEMESKHIKDSYAEPQIVKQKDLPIVDVHTISNDERDISKELASAMICKMKISNFKIKFEKKDSPTLEVQKKSIFNEKDDQNNQRLGNEINGYKNDSKENRDEGYEVISVVAFEENNKTTVDKATQRYKSFGTSDPEAGKCNMSIDF